MKIGIYGGSFNPIHKGHIKVAEFAIKNLGLDKLIFVPAFKSPFKSKVKYVDAQHRIEMIRLAMPEKSEISEFETNRKGTSYTHETLEHFKRKYPNDEIFLIIGSDNVYKLNKWRKINEISEMAKIAVFRRAGDFSKINIKRYGAVLLDNPLYDYASSWFRKGYLDNVDEKIMRYISSNYLYIPEIMKHMLDAKRHKHSVSVGHFAAEFAKSAGIDAKKAWATGSLHDITKSKSTEWHRMYLEKKGYDNDKIKNFELHALTGMLWVRDEYKLDDEEVLNAILRHTSLADELSTLDKVIFAADKMCEGRTHQGIQKDRQLILEDFDAGFKKIVNVVHGILLEMDRDLSPEQEEIYKRWM